LLTRPCKKQEVTPSPTPEAPARSFTPDISHSVDMKVLLVSATGNSAKEPSLANARLMLTAMGVPYTEYAVNASEANAAIALTGSYLIL